jgi:1,2-diacylglycerol 3-alpha-glucosyltransferase
MKIVGLTSSSGPYIRARWSAVAQEYAEHEVYLVEFGKVSSTYAWQPVEVSLPYQRIVLSDRPAQFQSLSQLVHLIQLLIKALNQLQPDVVVLNGYQQPATLAALIWCQFQRRPTVLLSESKEDDSARTGWRETLKRSMLKAYGAALVGGKSHKQYLVKLGMPAEAIFLGYDVVGNAAYHPKLIKGCDRPIQKPYFLSINRFIPKKNLAFLISAYAAYRRVAGDRAWDLVLCGDGELRSELEAQIKQLHLQEVVHLPGFLQQEEMLPYFAHGSGLIHASIQEQWGLVVNEAMAAGLPVLVSNRCGCFEELVIEGVTGFGFDPTDQDQLMRLMLALSLEQVDLARMSQGALTHIQNFAPEQFAHGLMQAVTHAVSLSQPHALLSSRQSL